MSDPLADEAFERGTYRCGGGKGHPVREMEEVKEHPDDPRTRYFVCPACDNSFWERIESDEGRGEAVCYRSDESLPF